MKRISFIFLILSHLFSCIALPVCCVLEYYAWMKMGMYRYLVLKNTWWMKNVFTAEAVPFILIGAVIVILAITLRCVPMKSYCFIYGILLVCLSAYLFRVDYFFSLRAAPWFGISLISSEVFFLLSAVARKKSS